MPQVALEPGRKSGACEAGMKLNRPILLGAAALALLRRAERTPGHGARTLIAAPPVITLIESHPAWATELSKRTGTAILLRADPARAISAGDVSSETP